MLHEPTSSAINSNSGSHSTDNSSTQSLKISIVPNTASQQSQKDNNCELNFGQRHGLVEHRAKPRVHPFIQHHPPIHPHLHYQRSPASPTTNTAVMTADCSNGILSSDSASFKPSYNCDILQTLQPVNKGIESNGADPHNNSKNNSSDCYDNSDDKDPLTNEIRQMQDLIEELNSEIFKNPRNCTQPPSEYLEVYNDITEKLHHLQLRKQSIDNNNSSSGASTANLPASPSQEAISTSNDGDNKNNNYSPYSRNNCLNSNEPGAKKDGFQNNSPSLNSRKVVTQKPPLPKSSNSSSCTIPKFKLDHPTSLHTNSNQQSMCSITPPMATKSSSNTTSPQLYHNRSPQTTSTTQFYISNSLHTSPATTPLGNLSATNSTTDVDNHSSSPPGDHLSLTGQSPPYRSLPGNSRSFGDINEAMHTTQPSTPTYISYNNSFSPSHSMSSTPSAFLRIYIGSSTAVVEKKSLPLREALANKLKSRNLEVDKCIAYIKESCVKVEWDRDVSKISADNIVVAELSDEIQHSFEKKTFTFRSCDWCKKRYVLNAYACTKCDYILCPRNECRIKSERSVCAPNHRILPASSLATQAVSQQLKPTDPNYDSTLGCRPESPIRADTPINISQQILPVNQLKVSIPCRDRSRSETELNHQFPSSMLNTGSNSFGKQQSQSLAISDNINAAISGNVNEESGSVISSLVTSKSSELSSIADPVNYRNPDSLKKPAIQKMQKPLRRDSFNAWEIPFKQITIDMNRKVGSGSFGIVHQATLFYHGTVAIKFLNVQNPTPNQSRDFRNEVAILKYTRHDNVLSFIGCILKPYLAIVTEWCPGSSLYKHIHVEEEHWNMNQLLEIAKQTGTGMEYLHAKDILHRDLKSNNIFLIPKQSYQARYKNHNQYYNQNHYTQNGVIKFANDSIDDMWTVKIGDFGLATVKSTYTQSAKTNQPTGSILWMAPEVITQKVADPYTHKSDVYSFAVVLYELVTGHLPYLKKEQNMILFMVGSGRLKLNVDDSRDDTPDGIKDLIKTCSDFDRNKRLEFVEINDALKKIRPVRLKTKLQRAQSVPNLDYAYDEEQT